MKKTMGSVVASGAAIAAIAGGVVVQGAAPAQARVKLNNIQLHSMWGKNLCLSMAGSKKSGAAPRIAKCSKHKTQRWTFKYERYGSYGYKLRNDHSGKCLYVGSTRQGAAIKQATCPKYNDQKFRWRPVNKAGAEKGHIRNYEKLRNAYSGKVITFGSRVGSKAVSGKAKTGSKHQSWYLPAFV
ncbi:RICIN domain-containing protein [Streptomyces sp. NPDC059009]|uniref:RICIN domain-containing protein n=1 Tax=Streptomyces sp. NPDC059009 TaxID=3346694 RepID=UPI0036C38162